MFFPIEDWFAAFVLTLLVETPVVVALLAPAEPDLPRRVGLALFASLASHPVVWYVITQLLLVGSVEFIVVAEAWAVAAEAAFYALAVRGITGRRALGVSLAANAASFAAGYLIRHILPQGF